jgi:hypothetical protein
MTATEVTRDGGGVAGHLHTLERWRDSHSYGFEVERSGE